MEDKPAERKQRDRRDKTVAAAAPQDPQTRRPPMPDQNTRHMHRPSHVGRQDHPGQCSTRPCARRDQPAGGVRPMQRPQGENVRPCTLWNEGGRGNPRPGVGSLAVGAADFGLYGSPSPRTARNTWGDSRRFSQCGATEHRLGYRAVGAAVGCLNGLAAGDAAGARNRVE